MSESDTTLTKSRWTAYATAGAASALGVMGVQENVEAGITVVDVGTYLEDRTQGDGYFDVFGPYTFGAAGASFVFQQAFNETASNEGQLTVVGNGNMSITGFGAGAYFYPSNLAYGAALSGGPFGVSAPNRGDMAWGGGYTYSQWLNPGTGFLGFRFDLGGGFQYGWAEIDMEGVPGNRGTLVSYGWGMPGEEITAGQRPPSGIVPEPGSLGMLALGSAGLMMWRRKRAADARQAQVQV